MGVRRVDGKWSGASADLPQVHFLKERYFISRCYIYRYYIYIIYRYLPYAHE